MSETTQPYTHVCDDLTLHCYTRGDTKLYITKPKNAPWQVQDGEDAIANIEHCPWCGLELVTEEQD